MIQFLDSRLPDRFWRLVQPCPMTGCWLFAGGQNGRGYGQYRHDGKHSYAHRVAFVALSGEIPAGTELDHLCRVRACCNPSHLEPVQRAVNVQRGRAGEVLVAGNRKRWAQITHCPYGHEYAGANLYVSAAGTRARLKCKAIRRMRERGDITSGGPLGPPSPEMLAWADTLFARELEKRGGVTRKPGSKFEEVETKPRALAEAG